MGIDWYVIDHKEDLSAFDGQVLEAEVQYMLFVMRFLKDRYNISGSANCVPVGSESAFFRRKRGEIPQLCQDAPSKGLILMGHSMGGVVARAGLAHAATDPTLGPNVAVLLLTLASPHQRSPLLLQPGLARFYTDLENTPLPNVAFVSVDPGSSDVQVGAEA